MAQITMRQEYERDADALLPLLRALRDEQKVWPQILRVEYGGPTELEEVVEAVTEMEPRDRVRVMIGVDADLDTTGLNQQDAERGVETVVGLVQDSGDGRVHSYDVTVTYYPLDEDDIEWLGEQLVEEEPGASQDEDGEEPEEEPEEEPDDEDDTDEQGGDDEDDEVEEPEAVVAVVEFARVKPRTGRRARVDNHEE